MTVRCTHTHRHIHTHRYRHALYGRVHCFAFSRVASAWPERARPARGRRQPTRKKPSAFWRSAQRRAEGSELITIKCCMYVCVFLSVVIVCFCFSNIFPLWCLRLAVSLSTFIYACFRSFFHVRLLCSIFWQKCWSRVRPISSLSDCRRNGIGGGHACFCGLGVEGGRRAQIFAIAVRHDSFNEFCSVLYFGIQVVFGIVARDCGAKAPQCVHPLIPSLSEVGVFCESAAERKGCIMRARCP